MERGERGWRAARFSRRIRISRLCPTLLVMVDVDESSSVRD